MHIAFTGSRRLNEAQELDIQKNLESIASYKADWHVGDAPGLDALVRGVAGYYSKQLTVYKVEGTEKWHFAARSKRMVDAAATLDNPWLYAFPNKFCPDGCKPCKSPSGKGSGTWLTIAYAKYRGLQICIFPQFSTQPEDKSWLPEWLKDEPENKQLNLF
ncbi:hypothetical protein [Brunnivagina elsteri]|uniref:Uncharacterized protein n=1 Tax=Brunnivagina elsteri CCALA 953 TaxID=987040 RepID=A0A2A2TLT3_9CYAN|nr:hypothetical protein [Calothrix elsteri]PAX59428.1 hypothetical protein CK510_06990 [Calothrix elsteri CCALA 953]